jgi:hypothetical protein
MLVLLTSGRARLNKWLHTANKTVVGPAELDPPAFGSPVRANAVQASCIVSERF